jgi:hypothetical protein
MVGERDEGSVASKQSGSRGSGAGLRARRRDRRGRAERHGRGGSGAVEGAAWGRRRGGVNP